MPETPKFDFLPILRILSKHEVDFILVGGVAAAIQGAPVITLDLHVLYSTAVSSLIRLLMAIEELDGCYRLQPENRLKPQLSHLVAGGDNLLLTRFGPLDLLGRIGNSRKYQDAGPHAIPIDIGQGLTVRVLDLETLIDVKEEAGGENDLAMLPVLRRTLEESRRR